MDTKSLEVLKSYVTFFKENPSNLHYSSFAFFKSFLQSFGAQIPPSDEELGGDGEEHHEDETKSESKKRKLVYTAEDFDNGIVESDVDLDDSYVVEPDNDPPQNMGNPFIKVTEENQEAARVSESKAMDSISFGKFNEAIDHLTEAIMLNPMSAMFYANRANVFVMLKKPNAAIEDADAALEIDQNSALGYKARGMARAMLGLWEEAASDLHVASNLDSDDEQIALMLKMVEPNAIKVETHRKKYKFVKAMQHMRQMQINQCRRNNEEIPRLPFTREKAAAELKDGEVIVINSASELNIKLFAACKLRRLAIIYFMATWCGPCCYMSPEYTSLAVKYPKVVFLKVDIDEAADVAIAYKVSSIPNFFFVIEGKQIDQLVTVDKNTLGEKIARHSAV